MNADALLLYSYLMRQDIPFTRFCHPAYRCLLYTSDAADE